MTAALSVGFAGVASAQVNHIYLSGSTAFRAATFNAVKASFDAAPTVAAWGCAAANLVPTGEIQAQTGKFMMFSNTVSSTPTIVKCAWSGSEAGIQDVVQNSTKFEGFPTDDQLTGNITLTTGVPNTNDQSHVDIAMADNSQVSSKTKTPALTGFCKAGVIPFVWCKNNQTNSSITTAPADWSAISNLSDANLALALAGNLKMAQLIGDPANTKYCYVAGRNNNSGTRVNAYLTAGQPILLNSQQIQIAAGPGGTATNSALLASATTPYPGGSPATGGNGQDSGGTLGNTMTIAGSATTTDGVNGGTGWYAVAYIGIPDFFGAQLGGAVSLTFNGVPFSVGNVQEGTYTMWNYEYSYLANGDTATGGNIAAFNFFNTMCTKWDSSINAGFEISLASMHCVKATDQADPVHN